MPVTALQTQSEKDRLLRNIPAGTHRVQVRTSTGKTKFKRPDEVGRDDQIMLNRDGIPIVMQGRPGRKPKVELEPSTDKIGEVMAARRDHLASDDLIGAAATDPESDQVIDNILQAMAEEASSLEFERKEAERHGKDTSSVSARRARVLKAMADTWLKRKERLQAGNIDLESPAFKALMGFMLETFRGALEDASVRPENIETVFAKLAKRLESGWTEEARVRIREKV